MRLSICYRLSVMDNYFSKGDFRREFRSRVFTLWVAKTCVIVIFLFIQILLYAVLCVIIKQRLGTSDHWHNLWKKQEQHTPLIFDIWLALMVLLQVTLQHRANKHLLKTWKIFLLQFQRWIKDLTENTQKASEPCIDSSSDT